MNVIQYIEDKKTFVLYTENTCYAFKIAHGKFPVHLYYGSRKNAVFHYEEEAVNFAPVVSGEDVFSLDAAMLEFSGFETGDYRTTSVRVKGRHNNGDTCFTYCGYRIIKGVVPVPGLPYAKEGENTETLEVKLCDKVLGCNLYLLYTVYPDCDVIVRSAKIENISAEELLVENCMSLCLDLQGHDYDVVTLAGCYGNEMQKQRNPLFFGAQRVFSRRGATSHQFNPFMALCTKDADREHGSVYAVNLIYSGDFVTEAEVSSVSLEKEVRTYTRLQTGIISDKFKYRLDLNESFTSPQGILTYSDAGFRKMTENFHEFTRRYILSKPLKQNPIVLNTWEGCYFDIDEGKLLDFARECKKMGVDTLVVDDGWFGCRDNDKSSLGDWFVNDKKFPSGIDVFAEKVRACGLELGIWIEPEMISADSKLYRNNPEWVLGNPNRTLSMGRNQYVLDMANPAVIEYLKKTLNELFCKTKVSYVKWDMNRHASETGSLHLPSERQGETSFRYMQGVYALLEWLKKEHPNIVLETCSGGGGRYDLGMMAYSSLIWCSDNTYPKKRAYIQGGALLAYPPNLMSCHISNPNGACEDIKELRYRYAIAAQGQLGFEMDISKVSEKTKAEMGALIEDYKRLREVVTNGKYAALLEPDESEFFACSYSNEREIFVDIARVGAAKERFVTFKLPSAEKNAAYTERYSGAKVLGKDLIEGVKIETGSDERFCLLLHYVKE